MALAGAGLLVPGHVTWTKLRGGPVALCGAGGGCDVVRPGGAELRRGRRPDLGPVRVAPRQTCRVPFPAPAEFDFASSAHEDGQRAIVVERAPRPVWERLRWRMANALGF